MSIRRFQIVKLRSLFCVFCCWAMLAAGALEPVAGIVVQEDSGVLTFGGMSLELGVFDAKWALTRNRTARVDPRIGAEGTWEADWNAPQFSIAMSYRVAAPDTLELQWRLLRKDAGSADALRTPFVNVVIPANDYSATALLYDDKRLLFPTRREQFELLSDDAKKIILFGNDGFRYELEGALHFTAVDQRHFQNDEYGVRLSFQGDSGAELHLRIRRTPAQFAPVSLARVANMGYQDEVPGDGEGGWSDQGSNDLRIFDPAQKTFAAVPFQLVDPEQNDGRSCLVLGNATRRTFPAEAVVEAGGVSGHALMLLHATTWTATSGEVGRVRVEYADGVVEEIPVEFQNAVGDWWNPRPRGNGEVVWRGRNSEADVGLYLSRFLLRPVAIRTLRFANVRPPESNTLWMIVGAVVGDAIPAAQYDDELVRLQPDAEWLPILDTPEVLAGSALDFSQFVAAPAGQWGPVVDRGGRLEFADRPGIQARFWGTNLCFGTNFVKKEEADRLAKLLVANGYNSVRLHHYDVLLSRNDAASSLDFDPERLDELDYLFYSMKQAGLYLTLDLYTARRIRENEIPGFGPNSNYKAWLLLSPEARDNWRSFARQLLTHRNPYTGLTWGEDPALIDICLVNENPITLPIMTEAGQPAAMFQAAYAAWLTEQDGRWDQLAEVQRKNLFLSELAIRMHRDMTAYLRELGVKALTTSLNCNSTWWESGIREELELVDNHLYWDHPQFTEVEWGHPFAQNQQSAVAALAPVPAELLPSRFYGKPFLMTELEYCYPNTFRAEGAALLGAYGALQEVDGMWQFAFSHEGKERDILDEPQAINSFDLIWDPVRRIGQRLVSVLYLRGDVRPSEQYFAVAYEDSGRWSFDKLSQETMQIGLYGKIGTIHWGCTSHPACVEWNAKVGSGAVKVVAAEEQSRTAAAHIDRSVLARPEFDLANRRIASSTGEIVCDGAAGNFLVTTARTECAVLNGGERGEFPCLRVENLSAEPAVTALISLDGQPLAQSGRMLLLHLTDAQNQNAAFRGRKMQLWLERGSAPVLVRRGQCRVSLPNLSGNVRIYPLSANGTRGVPLVETADRQWLLDSAVVPQTATLAYEVVQLEPSHNPAEQ